MTEEHKGQVNFVKILPHPQRGGQPIIEITPKGENFLNRMVIEADLLSA